MDLELIQRIGGIIVAGITIGSFIYKKMIIAYFKKKREQIKRQQEIWDKIDKIEKEFSPNSGSSLTDKVNMTCAAVKEIKFSMDKISGKQMADYYASKTPMFEAGKNGECIWVNHSYCNITGRSFDEIEGEGWRACIHDEDAERVFINWEHCVKDQRDFHDKYRFKRPDGEIVHIECDAHRIKDSSNNVMGWLGYLKVYSQNINLNY